MYGGGTGEVCGEVMKEHLTIGKADKQGDSELFGEVLSFFSMKIMEVVLTIEIVFAGFYRWLLSPLEIASELVRDGF